MGVGTDLVHVPRMARLVVRWEHDFLRRIFTENEIAYCNRHVEPAKHYAARFAAKEAFYKSVSGGHPLELGFLDAWVDNPQRAPVLGMSPKAWKYAVARGANHFDLSVAHDGDYALATVVASAQ
ncbi:MAG: holo-ACP synthase [Deltaproteobacteria bacterium]|nr:holo-ACP synthase [Deltaproteobacteria bacterium]